MFQDRLELGSTLHQRLLSDVASAPLQQIEGINACAARAPVQQRSEIWLSRGTRRNQLAVDDAGADR
jgi:hypothetical protein